MGDEKQNRQENRVPVEKMPSEVRQFADTMLGLNPHWDFEAWLIEQASMAMDLLATDLIREKMMINHACPVLNSWVAGWKLTNWSLATIRINETCSTALTSTTPIH